MTQREQENIFIVPNDFGTSDDAEVFTRPRIPGNPRSRQISASVIPEEVSRAVDRSPPVFLRFGGKESKFDGSTYVFPKVIVGISSIQVVDFDLIVPAGVTRVFIRLIGSGSSIESGNRSDLLYMIPVEDFRCRVVCKKHGIEVPILMKKNEHVRISFTDQNDNVISLHPDFDLMFRIR
jgi:hypothetical protein